MTDGQPKVFGPATRSLAVGLLLTVTMIAFEALGVATAMPVTAEDLDGVSLYGWAFSATTLASLLGIAVAGGQTDRHGPARPFAVGLVLFTAGLLGAGLAGSMPVLVAFRFLQGLGAGVLPPVVYASIGRSFDEAGRARMFALLSSAWVLPGIVGPAVSGGVAEHFGWRWIFLGILPLVPVTAILALPALHRLGAPQARPAGKVADRQRALRAVQLAVGAGVFTTGLGLHSLRGLPLLAVGLALAVPALRSLLPAGSLHAAPGLAAAVATRGLQTFAFFGAQAFLPLALTSVRGLSPLQAGLVLTAATLTWTMGAWLQERRGARLGRHVLVVNGLALVTVGIAGLALVLVPSVPVLAGAAAWTLGGLGMGMSYSGLSLLILAKAEPGNEGVATSSMQLSDVLGVATGTGVGGAAVAAGEAFGWNRSSGIAIAFAAAVASALLAVTAARRIDGAGVGPLGPGGGAPVEIDPAARAG